MAHTDYTVRNLALPFCPTARLASAIGPFDTTATMTGFTSPVAEGIRIGMAAMIGGEIVVIEARSGNTLTLGRGTCDTIPAPHAANTPIFFFEDSLGSDDRQYVATESIGLKPLPRTNSGGPLAIEASPPEGLTFNWRFHRPYPPGDVRINGFPFTTVETLGPGTADLTLTWVHRDRIVQMDQLVKHGEASIGPEPGTTYRVRVIRTSDGTVVRTADLGAVTSWVYTRAQAVADFGALPDDVNAHLTLESRRDGLSSWQAYRVDFIVGSAAESYMVNAVAAGGVNGGTTSAVGVQLNGLDAAARYLVTAPDGLTYDGWSGWPSDDSLIPPTTPSNQKWGNGVQITGGPGAAVGIGLPRTRTFGVTTGWPNGEAARSAFRGGILTGYTQYSFWFNDPSPNDNRGGMSLVLNRIFAPYNFAQEVLTDYPLAYFKMQAVSGTYEPNYGWSASPESGGYLGAYSLNQGSLIPGHGAVRFLGSGGDGRLNSTLTGQAAQMTLEVVFVANAAGQVASGGPLISKNFFFATTAASFPCALIYRADNTVALTLSSGNDFTVDATIATSALTPGVTYHVVAVIRNGGLCEIYVNSTLAASSSIGFSLSTSAANWTLGGSTPNSGGIGSASFNGLIGMGAVYLQALSSERIAAHYAAMTL